MVIKSLSCKMEVFPYFNFIHMCMNAEVIFTCCQAVPYASFFFFLNAYQCQVANVVQPSYTLPAFVHMYARVCVFFPSQPVLPFFIHLQEENKICTGVQIPLKTIVVINKAQSQGFFQIPPALAILYMTGTPTVKMLTPWWCWSFLHCFIILLLTTQW